MPSDQQQLSKPEGHIPEIGANPPNVSQHVSSTTNPPATTKTARQPRIKKEAAKILADAFDGGKTQPTTQEKKELLARIHAIPGNDHYTLVNVNRWFANKRAKSKAHNDTVEDVAFGSGGTPVLQPCSALTSEHITKLNTLFHQGTINPSQEVIDVWAMLLQVPSADVTTWVNVEKEKLKNPTSDSMPSRSASSTAHPSPDFDASTSPEPMSIDLPSIKKERARTEDIKSRVSLASLQAPLAPSPPPPTTVDPIRTKLLLAIHGELSNLTHLPSPQCHSREDFEALFGSYTQPMKSFLEQVQNGSMDKLGFRAEWATVDG
ncbi:hypothetical protein AAF712_000268 [Marasmius tenuissimus]|uniref:Homeobox domain-containing protein n=1 Tax=Marasmius tenuissimus TaxID=585030 RepID=A0ABR3AGB4_9AGAR|nr:hypothetical protein PM082_001052 [Marasmius tenuissimus]